ncbi:MAG: helix-turn-helix domain-containing protein [Marmoricola sp.]
MHPETFEAVDSQTVTDSVNAIVGARLRQLRENAGISLTELARTADISKAHLSRLEGGSRAFSLATLLTLTSHLGVPVAALLPSPNTNSPEVVPASGPIVRAADLFVRPLSHRKDAALQPFHVTVPAARDWSPGATHLGEEWIYVLKGALSVEHGTRVDSLNQGDSIHLDAMQPHRLVATVEAELIVVTADRSARGDHDG